MANPLPSHDSGACLTVGMRISLQKPSVFAMLEGSFLLSSSTISSTAERKQRGHTRQHKGQKQAQRQGRTASHMAWHRNASHGMAHSPALMSWGVNNISCVCCPLSTAKCSNVLKDTFLFTASMKTSNSSMHLIGVLILLQTAIRKQIVVILFSPPDKEAILST